MLHSAVALSILLSFVSSELLGILTGGLISGGYIAFYLEQPFRVLSTMVLALITYGIVKLMYHFMLIYGRRRFVLTVVISILLSTLYERLFFYMSSIPFDTRIIGYIIPGLIANDFEKQGIFKTLFMVLIIAVVIWLFLHLNLI